MGASNTKSSVKLSATRVDRFCMESRAEEGVNRGNNVRKSRWKDRINLSIHREQF